MTRLLGACALIAGLAGCGADGEPIRPEARTNITIGTDGIRTSTGVSVRKGPVSIGVTL